MKKIGVLAVDNEVGFTETLKEYFMDNESIDISYQAENGIKGLEILQKHEDEIDLILLDFDLKSCDGIALLEVLNKLKIDKKVMVITSMQSQDMIQEILKYDIQYFLLKPFEFKDLEKRILKLFEVQKTKILDLRNDTIYFRTTKLLQELGMPANVKGYHYLRDAISLAIENPDILGSITKELYPEVANHFSSTTSRVERAMRHAIEISFTRGNLDKIEEIFCYSMDSNKAKPTNSEFISAIAEKIHTDIETDFIIA